MGERKRDGKKEMKKEKRERERETLHCAPPLKAKHFFWAGLFPFFGVRSACVFRRRRRRRRRRSSNPKRRSPDDWTSTSITSLSFPVFCFSLPS
jgi:hypothetical protein